MERNKNKGNVYERIRERSISVAFMVFVVFLLAAQLSLVIMFFDDEQFLIGLSVLIFTIIIALLWIFVFALSGIIEENRRDEKEVENAKTPQ